VHARASCQLRLRQELAETDAPEVVGKGHHHPTC
jgi:hypothetical protein